MKHIPRKRFGQNFLKDQSVLDAIISAIAPCYSDIMLEIGPGLGAMTEKLLHHLARLDVIELDRDLVAYLTNRFPTEKLAVHCGDALDFDIHSLTACSDRKIRIVGNLPYNISTPLLFHLMDFASSIEDQHFMLQKEVVNRLVAGPGSKTYGRLSVMAQYYCQVVPVLDVPPTAFRPAPKVDSAVVRLIPHRENPYVLKDVALLSRVTTQAFNQRRKTIRNSLGDLFSPETLTELGIDPATRAENISVAQYCLMANYLAEHPAS